MSRKRLITAVNVVDRELHRHLSEALEHLEEATEEYSNSHVSYAEEHLETCLDLLEGRGDAT